MSNNGIVKVAVTAWDTPAAIQSTAEGVIGAPSVPEIPRLDMHQLLEQLTQRADDLLTTQSRLRGLLRANAAVAADPSLPTLLLHIVDAALDLMQAQFAAIVVHGHDEQLEYFVHAGMDSELLTTIGNLPGGRGILGVLAEIPSEPQDPLPSGGPCSHPNESRAGGSYSAPIHVGNDVYGNLYLRAAAGATFSIEDEQLVTALAGSAGVAIANARLLAESEQRLRWLGASSQLTNRLLATAKKERLACVTEATTTAADADFSTLTVPHIGGEVRVAAVNGAAAQELIDQTAAMDNSPAGHTIRTGTPVMLAGRQADADGADDIAAGPTIIVPLSAGSDTRGALTISRTPGRDRFTSAELDMAVSFAVHAAVALALADARDTQINEAQVDDHDRIALDMHDHVIGELFAVGMGLQGLVAASRQPAHAARINTYVDTLDRVISEIRSTIFQLQPRRHDPAGLHTRILGIVEDHTDQLGYRPHLHVTGPIDLAIGEYLAADVLAVTREGLSNCARHAAATHVSVSVALHAELLTLEITDNGRGIGTTLRSSGLSNLRQRAHQHGGTLIVSQPGGIGTRLTWTAICGSGQRAHAG